MASSGTLASARTHTHRDPLGRYTPVSFSPNARWKFVRSRRASYVRRIGGDPDEREALIISQMIEAEWSALQAEAEARQLTGKLRLASLRIAAEHRRQLLLLDRDLAATTRARAAAKPDPSPGSRLADTKPLD